jgi:inhibitor of cysteine peptidase
MPTITLSETDDGTTVETRRDDELVLQLRENPTTGYRWQVERIEGSLVQEDDAFQPDPEAQFGSGGVRELRFRVRGAGSGLIELKHRQPWSAEESTTQQFTVNVSAAE